VVVRRALGGFFRRWSPSRRLVAFGRVLHEQTGDNRDDEIADAEIGEGGQHTDSLNQPRRHGRSDQRARAESPDGDAGNKAAAIWEPFHQRRHWNDVPKSESNPANEPVAEIQPPKFVRGEARQENTEAIECSAGQRDNAGSFSVHPQPAEERSETEHEDADSKGECDLRNTPSKLL